MDGLSKVFSGIIGISDLCVRLDIQSGGKQNVDLLFQRSLIDVNGVCLDQDALPNNRHIRGGNMLQKPADAGTDEVPHIVLVALTVLDDLLILYHLDAVEIVVQLLVHPIAVITDPPHICFFGLSMAVKIAVDVGHSLPDDKHAHVCLVTAFCSASLNSCWCS